jgi:glycosyltransferase involved in cell wall biosynthesis
MRIPLIYALHSGNLYGTERMALSTAAGLLDRFDPTIMAPRGPALEEARRRGYGVAPFENAWQFAKALHGLLARSSQAAFLATGVMHSSVCLALNKLYRRRIAHLHLVHGGAAEKLSYGRKRKLNGQPIRFVAVSSYVRDRLIAHQVNAGQIQVIENFLPDAQLAACPRRKPFRTGEIRRLIVISRLDPEKRVGLLLDALERDPESRRFEVRIFGTGWEGEALKRRAAAAGLNVSFAGFQPDVDACLAESDLLVHLCPVEPFGLAIIEAMAAGVPVLAPNAGGAGSLLEDGISGFHFRADDADHLTARLREISKLSPDKLNCIVEQGRQLLATRFSEAARLGDYRRILVEKLHLEEGT